MIIRYYLYRYIPSEDLVNIYVDMYGQSDVITADVINNCTLLLYLQRYRHTYRQTYMHAYIHHHHRRHRHHHHHAHALSWSVDSFHEVVLPMFSILSMFPCCVEAKVVRLEICIHSSLYTSVTLFLLLIVHGGGGGCSR